MKGVMEKERVRRIRSRGHGRKFSRKRARKCQSHSPKGEFEVMDEPLVQVDRRQFNNPPTNAIMYRCNINVARIRLALQDLRDNSWRPVVYQLLVYYNISMFLLLWFDFYPSKIPVVLFFACTAVFIAMQFCKGTDAPRSGQVIIHGPYAEPASTKHVVINPIFKHLYDVKSLVFQMLVFLDVSIACLAAFALYPYSNIPIIVFFFCTGLLVALQFDEYDDE